MSENNYLTPKEMARYARHIAIPEFGVEGQEKLKKARVLVVGAGGLGSPVLLYLAAAGVGHLGIVDFDSVDDSNLQRQVLYNVSDIGSSKAQTSKAKLQALNPHIHIEVVNTALTVDNAIEIISNYDIVADGTDNFPTRYLVNDACVLTGKVNVYASIFRFEGQVSVFNFLDKNGDRGPNYRDIFPEPPPPGMVPNCAEGGVLGVLPGIIGSLQANEVIKVITGIGEPLAGRLFLFDAAEFITRTLKIAKNNSLKITELIDYDEFCGINSDTKPGIKEVSVLELKSMMDSGKDIQIIDVREPYEYDIANIGAQLIPLMDLDGKVDLISKEKKVIVHCRSGVRSANAIKDLEARYGFSNLYNLTGGILEWSEKIDRGIPKY